MKYGLLGRKLGHSFSPQIHKALGGYDFGLFEREPEEVEEFLLHGDFKGIHVTIPYKREVIQYCAEISEASQATNSVNCIVRQEDGSLFGTNTDYYGFRYMVETSGIEVEGRKCLILGTGGVSGTVKKALEDMKAGEIIFISRSGENNYENLSKHYDARIIVNTTPVGMYPENGKAPLDVALFKDCEGVVDLIYNPLRTKLVLDAQKLGIKAVGGLTMLVAQAAEGCMLFTGKEISEEEIDAVAASLRRKQENLVLIAMPGGGKSSVGRALSKVTGKPFIDIDTEIEKETGRFPGDIIREDGEDEFRRIETEVMAQVLKKGGNIIATGGGVIERERNYNLLRQNGTIIYIQRDVKDLPSKGRPISQMTGLAALYERRHPVYSSWADVTVENTKIRETAEKIAELCGYMEEQ